MRHNGCRDFELVRNKVNRMAKKAIAKKPAAKGNFGARMAAARAAKAAKRGK